MKFASKDEEQRFLRQQWIEQRKVIRGFAVVICLHTVYVILVNTISGVIFTPLLLTFLFGVYPVISLSILFLSYYGPHRKMWIQRTWYVLLSIAGIMLSLAINLKSIFCTKGIEQPSTCTPMNRPVSGSNIAVIYILMGPFLLLVIMRNSIRYQLPPIVAIVSLTIYTIFITTPKVTIVTYFGFLIIIGAQLMGILVAYNRNSIERSRYLSNESNISLTDSLRLEVRERTKAEEKAREAEERRAQFTSVLFHEMRIPLNSVILSMNDLETDDVKAKLQAEQVENLERINSGLNSIISIINDSLDQRKMDEGKMQIVERPFVYHKILLDVCKSMESNWKSKNIRFETDFDADLDMLPVRLQGDDNLLRRVVANYLSNAAKFTPSDGLITLKTSLEERGADYVWVYTHVQDTGIGISEENQARLFKPFVQIDAAQNQGGKGSGLGLSICASIISSMAGTYGIKSKLGKGSIFWFRVRLVTTDIPVNYVNPEVPKRSSSDLPAEDKPKNDVQSKPLKGKEIPPKVYKILVTDDDPSTRRITAKVLSTRLGHITEIATDGIECIEKVQAAVEASAPFDIIFMDNQMPRMTGKEAIHYLREKGFRTPIISVTGSSDSAEASEIMAVGADLVLSKPTNIDQLREAIRTVAPYDLNMV